jgi:hypothetical protein
LQNYKLNILSFPVVVRDGGTDISASEYSGSVASAVLSGAASSVDDIATLNISAGVNTGDNLYVGVPPPYGSGKNLMKS